MEEENAPTKKGEPKNRIREWRPSLFIRLLRRPPIFWALAVFLAVIVWIGIWALFVGGNSQCNTQTNADANFAPFSGGYFSNGSGVVAIPVDDSSRPPLEIGDRVNLVSTILDPEISSTIIAENALVFSQDDRSVSVQLARSDLEAVVSALTSSRVTLILVSQNNF